MMITKDKNPSELEDYKKPLIKRMIMMIIKIKNKIL